MKQDKVPYEKQIFVCTNDRKGEKPSCGDQKGEEIFNELRRIAKERSLHPRIRVAQAKCLGQCSIGCNIMIYSRHPDKISEVGTSPNNIWYKQMTLADVQTFADQYLKKEPS